MRTKKTVPLIFSLGALLFAGLFFFRHWNESSRPLKPSQLDFTKSNQLQLLKQNNVKAFEKPQIQTPENFEEADLRQWSVIQKVIESKNDNDTSIDRDLKNLTPQVRAELRELYRHLPNENRNGRGLVAFLIARDLQTAEDLQFLKEIYEEAPCLSMTDCRRLDSAEAHQQIADQTSLNYPQLAGLYQLEVNLKNHPEHLHNPEIRHALESLLEEASRFPSSNIQNRAQRLQKTFGL